MIKHAHSRQNGHYTDSLLGTLVDKMQLIWNEKAFLDPFQKLVKTAIDEHADFKIAKLDRSRRITTDAARRWLTGKKVAVNIHTMGTSFFGKVRDVRRTKGRYQKRRMESRIPTDDGEVQGTGKQARSDSEWKGR